MTLLEILQKELKEFPKGMLYAVQDDDGEVKFGKHSQPKLRISGIWHIHESGNCHSITGLELAEDWYSAIVTKDMWENDRVKQIIVNVSGLSTEEKKQVNEALAKIIDSPKAPERGATLWDTVGSMYAPSSLRHHVGLDFYNSENQTHTPQQVLEMAGMATKRKVRAEFDPKQPISVDVSNCTEEEKKEVQQAFFDVGIKWATVASGFPYLNAKSYSNSAIDELCYDHLLYRTSPRTDSISHKQFLGLVYEPEQQGHVHAENMALYAEDAKTTDTPWKLWQFKDSDGNWWDCNHVILWCLTLKYRRKPKTHTVNGVEVPDLRIEPEVGDSYYLASPTEPALTRIYVTTGSSFASMWAKRGLCYAPTEEGMQAAILHAKAMLGEGI